VQFRIYVTTPPPVEGKINNDMGGDSIKVARHDPSTGRRKNQLEEAQAEHKRLIVTTPPPVEGKINFFAMKR